MSTGKLKVTVGEGDLVIVDADKEKSMRKLAATAAPFVQVQVEPASSLDVIQAEFEARLKEASAG